MLDLGHSLGLLMKLGKAKLEACVFHGSHWSLGDGLWRVLLAMVVSTRGLNGV